jgi:hypothetical protein
MNWERRTRNRWEAPGFEIRGVVIAGAVTYRAVQMGDRRTFFGVAEAWHRSAADARAWCEAKQMGMAANGRA